jgi:hypothetical protein
MSTQGFGAVSVKFGLSGNDAEVLLDGWSGPEEGFRWAEGYECALRLPPRPLAPDLLMTLWLTPARTAAKPIQTVQVRVNDSWVGCLTVHGPGEHAIPLPRSFLHETRENIVRFLFSHAFAPGELDPRETRELALAFHELRLEEARLELLSAPQLLAETAADQPSPAALKMLAERFTSVGQNCEFGMWQRRCEAEPLGLLRFASARLNNVLNGVRTNFLGIDDPGQLSMKCTGPGGEYMGHHDLYELDYHTFRYEGQFDVEPFARREPARLRFLARDLMDQIARAEKIFVIQRGNPQLTLEEVIPLLRAMRDRNPRVIMLYVTALGPQFPSLQGRVERCAPGLFHGYLQRLAPAEHAYDCDFEGWLKICSTVAASVPAIEPE